MFVNDSYSDCLDKSLMSRLGTLQQSWSLKIRFKTGRFIISKLLCLILNFEELQVLLYHFYEYYLCMSKEFNKRLQEGFEKYISD